MTPFKLAAVMLILGSVMAASHPALAQAEAPRPDRLAQAPAPEPTAPSEPAPVAPATPNQPAQPATTDPAAAETPPSADNSVGSVATLQGSASATRNNAARALNLSDAIFKGDTLQTAANATLSVTFDDDTTFTLKPNSRIAVDEFVYEQGGSHNAAVLDILRGTVAFIASNVAKTGDMKINTPNATMGIRGTTGLVEVGQATGATGQVAIKLYADADGHVGRIEVFGRDGAQLGSLTRGASGFAVRPGLAGGAQRFTAVPLQISAQEAERDRAFVRQTFAAQSRGRQMNIRRRNTQQRPNQPRPNQPRPGQRQQRQKQLRPNEPRQGQQRQNQLRPNEPRQGQQRSNQLRSNQPRPGPGQPQQRSNGLGPNQQRPAQRGQPQPGLQPRQAVPGLQPRQGVPGLQPRQPLPLGVRPPVQRPGGQPRLPVQPKKPARAQPPAKKKSDQKQ